MARYVVDLSAKAIVRWHRSHKQSFVGMQLSKTARPDSLSLRRLNRMLFSGKNRLY